MPASSDWLSGKQSTLLRVTEQRERGRGRKLGGVWNWSTPSRLNGVTKREREEGMRVGMIRLVASETERGAEDGGKNAS